MITPTRYFTDGTSIWKFVPGERAQTRYLDENKFGRSAFKDVSDFVTTDGEVWEIDATEGEAIS